MTINHQHDTDLIACAPEMISTIFVKPQSIQIIE